ncbi:MAG: cytochrome d ubiquinol oxidase subunit II [Legionella sp.]|nr:MAG: cytochrome d ubiquinol oxidase subunit II [Legionella sp.]
MSLDYELLRIIWWLIIGVLLIGFAVMDGFDLGVGIWLRSIAKTDMERRILINSIGATWEGNQVWFILGGGALFAAWPMLYAVSFSGFYLAMLVVLLALILRPVGFKYRSKLKDPRWRNFWDWALFVGGFVPALIFGVAVGNVIQGVPFFIDINLRPFYTGTFLQLLNPFALCSGLLSVLMLAMHGAFFLQVKTTGLLQQRAKQRAQICAVLVPMLFALCGYWVATRINGYVINGEIPHDGPSNPLYKSVSQQLGGWMFNYINYPWFILAPLLSIGSALLAALIVSWTRVAFVLSAVSVGGLIATVGLSMFPFILPSSTHPGNSLVVWDSSSSQTTLFIMLLATVFILPVVLVYTAWVYRVLRGKVTQESVMAEDGSY